MRRPLFAVAAVAALFVLSAAAASAGELILATEAESETSEAPQDESGIVPAVPQEAGGEDEEQQPWTARFLAPLVLTIGVVGLVLSAAAYVVRIKGRYRVAP